MNLYNLIPTIIYFAHILNNPHNHASAQVLANDIDLNDKDEVRKAFKDEDSLESIKYLFENAREHIDVQTINYVFKYSDNLETKKFLLENARNAIDAEAIKYVFKSSYNLEITKFLWENARNAIDSEAIKYLFKHSASNLEVIKFLIENAREHIDAETIKGAFKYSSNLEVTKFLLENARDAIDAETINDAFIFSYNLEIIKFLLENARNAIDARIIKYIFKNSSNLETKKFLLENARDAIDENMIASQSNFIKHWHGNQEKYPHINLEILAKEISAIVFGESNNYDSDTWQIIQENNLYQKPQDLILIGFNNYRGQWSEGLLELLDNKAKINYKVYRLSTKDTEDQHFLSFFDAFINPGAGDSFPEDGLEFQLSYLDDGRDHRDMEYAYQRVIDFAKQHNKPYLGICNGAQHLILNEGGYVSKVANHAGGNHDFIANSGSIIEFFAMNKEEQSAAILSGYFPNEIKFIINTQHNYAGVLGKTGDVELGGVSEAGAVEAIARNFYQMGYQFHPENKYHMAEDMVFGRNKNLLFNFIKIINLSKHVDIDNFSNKLQEMLSSAYSNAICTLDQDVCANPDMVVDFFSTNEALLMLGE